MVVSVFQENGMEAWKLCAGVLARAGKERRMGKWEEVRSRGLGLAACDALPLFLT